MSNSLRDQIIEKLTDALHPLQLNVENESHQHNVPLNSETHFKVTVVSSLFEGKPLVGRHQSIYALLKKEMAAGLHALALHTYTPDEWRQKGGSVTPSPQCLGGSKRK